MLVFLPDVKKEDLSQELLVRAEQGSALSGFDWIITSGYRPGVNGIDHGIANGPHMSHKAIDIRCHDSQTRFKIKKALYSVGFRRIGQNSIHLHVDCDETKPQDVEWIEPEPAL